MKKLYRNWTIHNLIAHPLSEIIYWIVRPFGKPRATKASEWIHDFTLPQEQELKALPDILEECGDPDPICVGGPAERVCPSCNERLDDPTLPQESICGP